MTITRIDIHIKTALDWYSGTDAGVYFGFFGPSGGREFRLDLSDVDDNEQGTKNWYFGPAPAYHAPDEPDSAFFERIAGQPGDYETAPNRIEADDIAGVYLRVDTTTDLWELDEAKCWFSDEDDTISSRWEAYRGDGTGKFRLGRQHGMYLYLGKYLNPWER